MLRVLFWKSKCSYSLFTVQMEPLSVILSLLLEQVKIKLKRSCFLRSFEWWVLGAHKIFLHPFNQCLLFSITVEWSLTVDYDGKNSCTLGLDLPSKFSFQKFKNLVCFMDPYMYFKKESWTSIWTPCFYVIYSAGCQRLFLLWLSVHPYGPSLCNYWWLKYTQAWWRKNIKPMYVSWQQKW